MRMVLQRVLSASVQVQTRLVGRIDRGVLIYLGIGQEDTMEDIAPAVQKVCQLRIFPNTAGKMHRSLLDTEYQLLVVSQFTLCADVSKGRRPSFTQAKEPTVAKSYYEHFLHCAAEELGDDRIASGEFGADMAVASVNEGPVTFIL